MHRLHRLTRRQTDGFDVLVEHLRQGWSEDAGGGLWWCQGKDIKNTPVNGPASILFARLGETAFAAALATWLTDHLVDSDTGLLWDGLRVNADGDIYEYDRRFFTYCQGVYIGACTELAIATREPVWAERASRTIAAVAEHLADADDVLPGYGGHDGGLFTGIACRYLAQASLRLPGATQARQVAALLVFNSAAAAWHGRNETTSGPLFGHDWRRPARLPLRPTPHHDGYWGNPDGEDIVEWDLSVQLGAWMTLEAAALLERAA
jgi:predicted alpha-1,6-mannanase (GH76 family)